MGDVCKPCQMSISNLKLAKIGFNGKKKDLIKAFFKRFIILLDNRLGVILISIS